MRLVQQGWDGGQARSDAGRHDTNEQPLTSSSCHQREAKHRSQLSSKKPAAATGRRNLLILILRPGSASLGVWGPGIAELRSVVSRVAS